MALSSDPRTRRRQMAAMRRDKHPLYAKNWRKISDDVREMKYQMGDYDDKKIAGSTGNYIGKYDGSDTWHRISAKSENEAKAKMLKGTRYTYSDVTIEKL